MDKVHTVIIADDHPMVSRGLMAMINAEPDLRVTHTVTGGLELLDLLIFESPDLIMLDISMVNMDGVQAARAIRARSQTQKILCISTFYEQSLYAVLRAVPVQGFIPKLSDMTELIDGMRKVLSGEDVYIIREDEHKESTRLLLTEISEKLSRRELELIQLIKTGYSSKEISEKLFISIFTVETHRKNICRKLNITQPNGLLKFAIENF